MAGDKEPTHRLAVTCHLPPVTSKLVLTTGLAPALATFSTSCLCIGLRELLAQGQQVGAPTRSCTGLTHLPSERIADNALGGVNLASLTGFAPVISCMRGRRVGWTTPQGQVERVNGVAPSSRPWHGRILLLNHTREMVSPAGLPPAAWRLGRAWSVH